MLTATALTREQLHQIGRDYVQKGLGAKNFDAIPYDDNVELRAPLNPGGSAKPIKGREVLRSQWWAPLPNLIGEVEIVDSFVNDDLTAVTVEMRCQILSPACTLRVMDKFTVNQQAKIIKQENFFDPRAVTNPD